VTTPAADKLVKQGADAYARSKWTLAEESFTKALEADPESYEAAAYLANTRWAARHFEAAAEAYAKAASLDPNQFYPVFMQGHIAYTLNNIARARQLLTAVAIPHWPDNPKSYEIAAYSLASEGRIYEARVYGECFIELSKAEGAAATNFQKWFEKLPSRAFSAGK
jgi:Tfp pilus assembly protein PilF